LSSSFIPHPINIIKNIPDRDKSKVISKTVVTDDFTTVSTITDNTTRTFADTDVSTGTYWYRVRVYNSNGDGIPSKVSKVELP
jgi:hypothetical protein